MSEDVYKAILIKCLTGRKPAVLSEELHDQGASLLQNVSEGGMAFVRVPGSLGCPGGSSCWGVHLSLLCSDVSYCNKGNNPQG